MKTFWKIYISDIEDHLVKIIGLGLLIIWAYIWGADFTYMLSFSLGFIMMDPISYRLVQYKHKISD